ncbi:MAG: hypothetical protein BWZ07_03114 [Alphaproteobacteria bacterium ADurb.BinA280]|nr:MAG: hypothetical protein BWZ07_03114 [Alphaproteobacteria bacterium ADurb.BinA280]
MRARRSEVIETAGEMHELGGNNANRKHSAEYKADFYAQLLGFAEARGYKPGYAFFAYKDKFGVQPSMTKPAPQTPKLEVINFLRSRQIARAKMAQKVAA